MVLHEFQNNDTKIWSDSIILYNFCMWSQVINNNMKEVPVVQWLSS